MPAALTASLTSRATRRGATTPQPSEVRVVLRFGMWQMLDQRLLQGRRQDRDPVFLWPHLVERGVPLASGARSARPRIGPRPSATTISDWKRSGQPLNGWKRARCSIRRSKPRTKCQESFKLRPNSASAMAKIPPTKTAEVTDSGQIGELAYRYGVLRKVVASSSQELRPEGHLER